MNKKEFQKFLERDGNRCWHCGADDDTLVIQHRANRGFGGSKRLDSAANLIVLCSRFNGLIESNADASNLAKAYGWKLSRYQNPELSPVFDAPTATWWLLSDDFTKGEWIR